MGGDGGFLFGAGALEKAGETITVIISNSKINSNKASEGGGFMNARGNCLVIANDIIATNNIAMKAGGFMYSFDSEFSCNNCYFENNYVSLAMGGTVAVTSTTNFRALKYSLTLIDVTIINSRANTKGGCVFLVNANFSLQNVNFINCFSQIDGM